MMCTPRMRSVVGVRQDLDEAVGGLVDLGAAVGGEGELADLVGDARGLELLLGLADGGDLRERVDDVGDHVVVHVARLAGEDLGHRHALVLGLVRQHRTRRSRRRWRRCRARWSGSARRRRCASWRRARRRRLPGRGLPCRARGRWRPAPRRPPPPCRRRRRRAGSMATLWPAAAPGDARHLARSLKLMPCLARMRWRAARHLGVDAGQDAVEELDHQHLGAEPAPHRAELEADHAGADHQQALGHLGKRQRAGGGDDRALVDGDAGQPCRHRSRWR